MSELLPVTRTRFSGPDGELSYWRAGSGSPLILLHSLALGAEMWRGIVGDLVGAHEVFALDLRGHGESAWSGRDFAVSQQGDDVGALLDHLGLERAHLLGLSMGGSVALTFAAQHPERVERLALFDTTAWYGEDAPSAWAERAALAEGRPRPDQIAFQVERWFTGEFCQRHPEVVSLVTGVFLATRSSVHAAACRALGALDSRDLIGSITAPTIVVTGREDFATPLAMGEALAGGIPGAEFLPAPGKHFAILESGRLRRVVLDHLSDRAFAVPAEEELADACCAAHRDVP